MNRQQIGQYLSRIGFSGDAAPTAAASATASSIVNALFMVPPSFIDTSVIVRIVFDFSIPYSCSLENICF